MDITYRIDKNILYISVSGRIDASNATEAEENIFNIKKDNHGKHTVLDADKLEYISSAGLRVILRLRKEEPKLAIINVAPDVYEIFVMTGFTDMITVEKAYQRMSVEGCEFLAKGAIGAVYRYDNETIIKSYFAKDALPEIKQERENARKAFVLGVNTAIPYGIVRIGDGYGTVTELLNAVSVTKLICDNPNDISKPVAYFVDMLKSIHAIKAEDGDFPDMKEIALSWANFVSDYLPKEQSEKLCALINAVPKQNTLVHGDYHTNNVMVQNGEPQLIDLDTLSMGHPVFELGSMFNAFIGFNEVRNQVIMDFFGFSYDTSKKVWEMSLKKYLNTEDDEICKSVAEKAMIIGYTRMLRRSILRPEEAESAMRIARCKEMLGILLNKVDSLEF